MLEQQLVVFLRHRSERGVGIEAARRRQQQVIEIFRQADLQSSLAHQIRHSQREFIVLAKEVLRLEQEVDSLLPIIVWIWDNVKDKQRFIEGLAEIETHFRAKADKLSDISDLLDLFHAAKRNPHSFFKEILSNLVVLASDDELFLHNPVETLRQIHHTQDRLFLTDAFLDLMCRVIETDEILDVGKVQKLKDAIHHITHLRVRLAEKEKMCR